MRNLNINELVEVQGGRISGSLAISIVGILSDLWTGRCLHECRLPIDREWRRSGLWCLQRHGGLLWRHVF